MSRDPDREERRQQHRRGGEAGRRHNESEKRRSEGAKDGPIAHRDANVELGGIETRANEHPKNPNVNCLEGMECPKCGSFGPFTIEVTKSVIMHDDGSEDIGGDETWNDGAHCRNDECEHFGILEEFRCGSSITFPTDHDYIRQQIEDFDSDCKEREHTDSGHAWDLLYLIYKRLGGDMANLSD